MGTWSSDLGGGVRARMCASILEQEVLFKSARSLFSALLSPICLGEERRQNGVMRMLRQERGTDVIIPVCEGNESTVVP